MPIFDLAVFDRTLQPDDSEIASEFVSLVCVTVLSLLIGIKTYNVQFKYLSCSRWLIIALYLLSWAFTVSAAIFETMCLAFFLKWLAIYFIQEQKWSYILAPVLKFIFHIAEIQENGVCIIGLELIASIPLLIYDFVFNTYMTILFIKPLMRSEDGTHVGWKASRLHDVARRTLVASIVALLVSFANILTLTLFNGRERGVLCLTCCTVDVTINVATIHWVTANRGKKIKKGQKNNTSSVPTNEASTEVPENIVSANADMHHFKNHYYNSQNTPSFELDYYTPKQDEDMKSSRPSSLQESQSSQKTLTKK
ncbi:hypothetical protein HPULCUR_009803 [Helicostylum pulchrum]|uniref:Transmembrane protein n=1 Tax=Helicostylum pulchrum TaxID=562976 RepID=A0ABP9YBH8_9FUNG